VVYISDFTALLVVPSLYERDNLGMAQRQRSQDGKSTC